MRKHLDMNKPSQTEVNKYLGSQSGGKSLFLAIGELKGRVSRISYRVKRVTCEAQSVKLIERIQSILNFFYHGSTKEWSLSWGR